MKKILLFSAFLSLTNIAHAQVSGNEAALCVVTMKFAAVRDAKNDADKERFLSASKKFIPVCNQKLGNSDCEQTIDLATTIIQSSSDKEFKNQVQKCQNSAKALK